jgi:hypothetical protein
MSTPEATSNPLSASKHPCLKLGVARKAATEVTGPHRIAHLECETHGDFH